MGLGSRVGLGSYGYAYVLESLFPKIENALRRFRYLNAWLGWEIKGSDFIHWPV